jgi:PST family polysaccharide transporter
MSRSGNHTYGQILKSSALIGGASVLNAALRVVRAKAMAMILGPSGFGLLGLYGSISDLTRSVAGMGINSSGVRQIAEAVGSGDSQRIARTITTLRRVAFCSGALGALFLLIFSKPVSRLTFGDDQHAGWVALLSLAAFFGDVSDGQGALVQGMRRIGDLARMNVLGAFYGTVFSIAIVYFYSTRGAAEGGVVPSLVCVAAMGIITSWWYARKIKVEQVRMTLQQVVSETSALLKLGVVFMASGMMPLGVAYLVRVIVVHKFSLEAAGYYQSAWVLGGFYFGFILQAMGADFYPRLTAVASNNAECNRLVNEQAEVGLLLAGPGVMATLTFAPWVIDLFYSAKFGPAVDIFRWICLGMMLRVMSWPMGFILLAKGERNLFFWTELLGNLLSVALVWLGVWMFGLEGTGIAFFAMYVVYWFGIYAVARRVSGFRWSPANRRLITLFVPVVAIIFAGWYVLPRGLMAAIGGTVTILVGIYSLKNICRMVPSSRFPKALRKALVGTKLIPPDADTSVGS